MSGLQLTTVDKACCSVAVAGLGLAMASTAPSMVAEMTDDWKRKRKLESIAKYGVFTGMIGVVLGVGGLFVGTAVSIARS